MKHFNILMVGLCVSAFNQMQGMEGYQVVFVFNKGKLEARYKRGPVFEQLVVLNQIIGMIGSSHNVHVQKSNAQRTKFIEMKRKLAITNK
jgi:hypothetical protein